MSGAHDKKIPTRSMAKQARTSIHRRLADVGTPKDGAFSPSSVGSLIDALGDYPDEEFCTVAFVKPAWVFTPAELANVSAQTVKRAFEQDLRRAGIAETEGPFVGFLHGEYEPTNNVFVLHFHCTTTRKKADHVARRLRRLKRTYRPNAIVKRPIRISKMKNRVDQLTYLLKRY